MTNKLIKRRTSKPIHFQGTVVILVGIAALSLPGGFSPVLIESLVRARTPVCVWLTLDWGGGGGGRGLGPPLSRG